MADNEEKSVSSAKNSSAQYAPYNQADHQEVDTEAKSSEFIPYGVRRIEIISSQYQNIYGRIAVFFSIFLVAYGYGLDGTTRYTFQTYATSSYSSHSLVATINTIRSTFAAAALPFIARLCDIFGRIEIFIISVLFYVIGTIIESQAYDVKRFAAGALFYQFGYTGSTVVLQLMAADFSFLNWRVTASFVPALPFIINTWISGNITSALVNTTSNRWSWGIGMWAFIYPLLSIPLILCYLHMYYLARKSGKLADAKRDDGTRRTTERLSWNPKSIVKAAWEMDIVGIILFAASLSCFLTPFTLAGGAKTSWQKGHIIAPLVVGFCLFPVLVYYEYYIQSRTFPWIIKPLLPTHMLADRGVWAAMGIAVFIDWVWYMQGDYLYTVLVVAVGESVNSATRISSLYSFVSVITGTILGFLIAYIRRIKVFIIFGISMWFVAFGLMIHYRGGSYAHSGMIGAQCLLGFGAGFFTYPAQASIASCTTHTYMSTAISLYLSMYYVGSAFGTSISGAIWTNILPEKLLDNLGDSTLATSVYGDPFTFALTYPMGTPERTAVIHSYSQTQKILCIVGICLIVPLFAFGFCLRDREMLSNEQSYDISAVEEAKAEHLSWSESIKSLFKIKLNSRSKDEKLNLKNTLAFKTR
ncbi:major facilitator superfamily domain-containing protein [Kockiozyma suomiensis]|uniref:major facilitator superfamily domain-containing protein n=1 Tax=Kockiozyma suomiensis TaxID=1337062 RepID=UPI003343C00A